MAEQATTPALENAAREALFPLLNNLYWVHLDIVGVCSKWVPRKERDDERAWLATQLAREAVEVPMYRRLIEDLGRLPDVRYRINDSLVRYRWLKETEDEVEVLVGMNILAQAVLGWIEHTSLYRFDPQFFAPLAETIAFDAGNWERAKIMIRRRDPASLEEQILRYRTHLLEITVPELIPLLEPVIAAGVLPADVFRIGIDRYAEAAAAVGVQLTEVVA